MAIYTFGIPEAAGMVARLDAEGGGGQVLVVGGTLREAGELIDAIAEAMPAWAEVAVFTRANGRRRLRLRSGLQVLAISGDGARGRTARMGILVPGVKPSDVRSLHRVVQPTHGALIAVNLPTPAQPAPEEPETTPEAK